MKSGIKLLKSLGLGCLLFIATGCASDVYQARQRVAAQPDPEMTVNIYFYPKQGQSALRQDRDRYECYLWAVEQSGFNPSSVNLAPHQQVVVRPDPPEGHDTALGAVSGAIIGAIIGSPHHTGGSAAVGAVAGAMIGAASDRSRADQAKAIEQEMNRRAPYGYATLEHKAQNYRRAMKACLEGRGYSVR
jgi:hypothetical protein